RLDSAGKKRKADLSTREDVIAADRVVIHYTKRCREQRAEVLTGFHFNRSDSLSGLYAALLNPLRQKEDLHVFDASGILKYDSKDKIWYFGDEKKLMADGVKGNVLKYEESKNRITGEGSFNLGLNLAPIKMATTGNIVHS